MNRIKRSIISTVLSLVMLFTVLAPAVQAVDWTALVYTDAKKLDILYSSWDEIEKREETLLRSKATHEEIMSEMYDYISSLDCVAEVIPESNQHFSFRYKSGLWSEYHHWIEQKPAEITEETLNKIRNAVTKDFEYTGEIRIGVYSPYYGSDPSMTQNYLEAAQAMQDVLGDVCEIESWYGGGGYSWATGAGSVESFKNCDRYGIILVDSHGSSNSALNKSYIWCPIPGNYNEEDVTQGHLVYSGGRIGVSGSYIQKYCDLPNSFIYLGICEGMKVTGTGDALVAGGAGFVCGYSESVTFRYDGEMMPTICESLLTSSANDPSRFMTASEACDYAKSVHGSQDPYGNPPAVLRYAGNHDLLVALPVEIEGGVDITQSEVTLYNNNSEQLLFTTDPVNATLFTKQWTSDNPSVISVTQDTGLVTAHSEGTATITLTATNIENGLVFTDTVVVTSLGHMPLSGIDFEYDEIELIVGEDTYTPKVLFTPASASNKNLTWQSNNNEIATVDENGAITAHSYGDAIITATSEDGNFTDTITVHVIDFNRAASVPNSSLSFDNTVSSYPWAICQDEDDMSLYVESGNRNVDSSTSKFTLTLDMLAGESLSFEYSVSSETNYDKLKFKVNGSEILSRDGVINWTSYTYNAPSTNTYTFSWEYTKDSSMSRNDDSARIRNVNYVGNNSCLVTFVDGVTGETIRSMNVGVGTVISSFPTAPTHDGYVFTGWDYDGQPIMADTVINALYDEIEMFTVSFYDVFDPANPRLISSIEVPSGHVLTAADYPTMPTYIGFTGAWNYDGEPITSDIDVAAIYTINTYVVNFCDDFDGDGNANIIRSIEVEHGYALTDSDIPAVPAHTGYTGVWDYDGSPITADTDIIAVYTINTYTVTFVDGFDAENPVEVSTITVDHGHVLTDADFPTMPEHEGYTGAWNYDGLAITGDTEIVANYTINTYTVTFVDGFDAENPVEISSMTVDYGYVLTDADFPTMPEHEGYTGAWNYDGLAVTADTTITAVYTLAPVNTVTVTFVDGITGEVIMTVDVEPDTVLTDMPEAPVHDGYVFIGWDYDGTPVTEAITVTAMYNLIADLNGDGTMNTGDAVLLLRAIAELDTLNDAQTIVADVNGDGKINTGDAVAILRMIAFGEQA